MTRAIRVLHLEDSPRDAEIIRHALDVASLSCDILLVSGKDSFEAALTAEPFDLIISDYNLPGYDGIAALKQAQATQPDVPVILVSGTVVEEQAVRCLHIGATDYLLKDRLDRLVPAVQRALQEAETQHTRQRAEAALGESEARKAAILDSVLDSIVTMDADGTVIEFNAAAARTFGYTRAQAIGRSLAELIIPLRFRERHRAGLARYVATGEGPLLGKLIELTAMRSDGVELPVELAITVIRSGSASLFTGVLRDITARKEAEATRARLAAIVDSSDDAVIGKDLTGRVTSWNRAAEQVFGFTANEMVGTSIDRLIPADRGDEERQIIEQITRGERVKHFETRRQTKDGPLIDVSITVSPIKDATGTVIGVSKVARDITEHKRAEEIVRQASGRVARNRRAHAGIDLAILAMATALIYVLAARFQWFEGIARWVLANELQQLPEMILSAVFIAAGLLVFGFRRWRETESELTTRQQAQAALGLLHEELDRRVKQRTEELGSANQALRTEIAERRRTGDALRTAEERTRFALEATGIGIWDRDYATGVVRWSDILEAQYGLQPGTFGGTIEASVERVHPEDRQSVIDAVGKAMKAGGNFTVQHRTTWPDGTVRWLSGAGRIHLGEHGEPVRGVGISLDVTERHTLEEQYQQSQKMEAIGQLAGGVAHDFNNLLTVILGFCELLLVDLDPDDPRQADIAEIQKAGMRAAGLTSQLLIFSRKEIIQPTMLDLNVIVADMRILLGRLIGEDVEVVLDLGPALAPVKADRGQVEQIVLNLAVNARDAMPKGGTLMIKTANVEPDECSAKAHFAVTPGPCVALTVTDTGTGVTPEVRARLFEPFFTTKGVGKGTGLGLATVHGIVTRSGGSVTVDSEVGKGTSFTVYFPQADAAERVVAAPPPVVRPPAGVQTVLVVEDAAGLRELTKRLLERLGYTVLVAANADKALRLFDANPSIDLLLTDVVMPGTSGPELVRQLVERRPALKVIYMSGYTDEAIIHHGVLEPGIAFLHKPFTSETLGRKIHEVLDQ